MRKLKTDLGAGREVRFDGFTLDFVRRLLLYHGQSISLRPKEFDLLGVLLEAYPNPLGYEELMFRLWPDGLVTDAALSQTVYRLRRALSRYSANVEYISTIPGRGYQFVGRLGEPGDDVPVRVSSRAFHLYRRAIFQISLCTASALEQAVTLLKEAIATDERYVPAIVALGQAHAVRAQMLIADSRVEYSSAKKCAVAALALEPSSGEAYALMSHVFLNFDRDSAAAGEAARTAISMAPHLSDAWVQLIWHLLATGDWNGAIAHVTRILTSDPSSSRMTALFGICLYYSGNAAAAHSQLAEALLMDNLDTRALLYDAMALLRMNEPQSAMGRLHAVVDNGSSPRIAALRAYAASRLGERAQYEALVDSLERSPGAWFQGAAIARTGAGDLDAACEALRRAFEIKEPGLLLSRFEPLLEPLRNRPEAVEIFDRISVRNRDWCEDCDSAISRASQRYQCSYACTFCHVCAAQLQYRCPNCSGALHPAAG